MSKLKFGTSISAVMVEKMNLDAAYYDDLRDGLGIRLDSPVAYTEKLDKFTKKKEKVYNGLQSTFFATDIGDDRAYEERFSCKCKKYIGKAYDGFVCDSCLSKVEYIEVDLRKTGWIVLENNFAVLTPIHYQKLAYALGKIDGDSVLDKILEVDYKDKGGLEYTEKELLNAKKHPFLHKGMMWLQENIEEVLEYYSRFRGKLNTNMKLAFQELYEDIPIMFTSHIPVHSAVLRTELPGEKGSKLFKLKINTCFQSIIRISNSINSIPIEEICDKEITINRQLNAIQKELSAIFEITYTSFMKKPGIIQSKIIGGRYNYSARNIITSSSGYLKPDEIEFSYITFLELYRSELLNFYAKTKKCTIMEASNAFEKAKIVFDETYYDIMMYMTHSKECKKYMYVLISRNPMINYLSCLMMRVSHVNPDIRNKTMKIPSNICKVTNADQRRGLGIVVILYRAFCERLTSGVSNLIAC